MWKWWDETRLTNAHHLQWARCEVPASQRPTFFRDGHGDDVIKWNRHMENHGKSWKIMENHGKSWKIMENHGKSWKNMEKHGQSSNCRCVFYLQKQYSLGFFSQIRKSQFFASPRPQAAGKQCHVWALPHGGRHTVHRHDRDFPVNMYNNDIIYIYIYIYDGLYNIMIYIYDGLYNIMIHIYIYVYIWWLI